MNIAAIVLSIIASIVSIVANYRLRRVEKKLIQVENKLTQVVTQGDNSPVLIAGGDVNVNFSQTYTNITPSGVKFGQPPTITPPGDTSP